MNINKNCKLFLKDLYLYDISACHYTIIQRLGYDVSKISSYDKFEKNKYIGLLMRGNPRLTTTLRTITTSTISEYLNKNNIEEDELILRQYDGVITTKRFTVTDLSIPIDLRHSLSHMIISINRDWYIGRDANKETVIKGIPHRYEKMDEIYRKLLTIGFGSNSGLFSSLQSIKDEILTSDDPSLYCIPTGNNKCNVFLKGYGEVGISQGMIKILDASDIDRERYFDFYVRPFTESLCIEFL